MNSSPHILITRPSGQHQPFIDELRALGMTVSHLPCLEITSLDDVHLHDDPAREHDSVLFTSVNAVGQAHRLRPLPWPGLAVYAIGAATCRALEERGQTLACPPSPPFNSESFLSQIAQRHAGRLLLVKGEGGRGLLQPSLQALGWQVDSIDVYRRQLPDLSTAQVDQIITQPWPDLVSVTSNESLHNLTILAARHLSRLRLLPLVVNSSRAAELARELGFEQPALIALTAGDPGQLACIRQWRAKANID